MNRRDRLRRVVILCASFARNLAYYRAGQGRLTNASPMFWRTVYNNFIEIDWCKLLGDQRGKHFWEKVVTDSSFKAEMLRHLSMAAEELESYVVEMREYRDKFLAHLDDLHIMNIPHLDPAKSAVEFYHRRVVMHEAVAGDLGDLPTDLPGYYTMCFDEAQTIYGRCGP